MPPPSAALAKPSPFDVRKVLSRADRARRAGNIALAASNYSDILTRFPSNPRARKALAAIGPSAAKALVEQAQKKQAAREFDAAEQLWATATALCPGHVGIGLSLARCRSDMARDHAALEAVDRVLRHHPEDSQALDSKGCILRDLGQQQKAEHCHMAALEHAQDRAGPLNHLGILARANGKSDDAANFFRQALADRPDSAPLHLNLSGCVTYRAGDSHIRHMQDHLADKDHDDPAQAPLHFALFKALDDIGDRNTAFSHLVRGNQLRKAESGYDTAREAQRFAWYKSLSAHPANELGFQPSTGPRPIFIVGLPRSGTTLVERILGQASTTQPAGELSVVSNAVAPLLRELQANARAAPTPQDIQSLRTRLLEGIARHSDGSPVLIDKMPLNFRWTGMICAALPEARIVSVNRAPMPVAWSLFRHFFSSRGNGFAYDMGDIAAYMLLHRDMMHFWSGRFANQITNLDYSALVSQTEITTRNLIDACDLSWTDDCLNPQASQAPVLTASALQVRRNVYSGSDEAWRQYETQLAPLSRALEAVGLT